MTYPQGPYGPHQGGYPQPGPYGPTGGHPHPGYGPPRKSNTGLIVGIIAAVLVALGALAITGFVAPGFFLSNDDSGGADTSTAAGAEEPMVTEGSAPSSTPPLPSSPEESAGDEAAVIADFVAKVNSGDSAGATNLACEMSRASMTANIDAMVAEGISISNTEEPEGSGSTASARITGTLGGKEASGSVNLSSSTAGATFCVISFSFLGY